ncbi:MAG: GHKL domain-containing protein [Scytonematopsis contorta HA4267-MV1]|jgi:signal transduction histidine kinase|nr:GHKL domain-containing protein [Scytonematopsis contorta HA4267-MV1]
MMLNLFNSYDFILVTLSVAIAIVASYTALSFNRLLKEGTDFSRIARLIGGSFAIGVGIWSMHFVGMISYKPLQAVTYDWKITVISLIPAFFGAAITFIVMSQSVLTPLDWLMSSLFMGTAIASMHYMGMASIEGHILHYHLIGVGLSILMAIFGSFLALWVGFQSYTENNQSNRTKRLISALIMGLTISSMHYTAIAALKIPTLNETSAESELNINQIKVAIATGIGTLIVIVLTFVSGIYNQKFNLEKAYSNLLEEKNSYLLESQKKLLQSEAELQSRTKQLEQVIHELQQLQLQIVQTEKMSTLGNLVAGVAHEINNPVTFIAGNINPAMDYIKDLFELISLYQKKCPNPDIEIQHHIKTIELDYIREDLPKLIDSMQEGIKRIRNISTSLRTFSRADNDRLLDCNIHDGIDSTILILQHRLKANKSRPEISVVKNYGQLSQVQCFPGQLNQVFMNLLANAIDALDESNIGRSFEEIKLNPNLITITTKISDDHKFVVINIKDNGIGINEEAKGRIFDYLYTTKAVGKGTGLGLAIARQIIVEKHGGSLFVNSAEKEGTEFVIQIPNS